MASPAKPFIKPASPGAPAIPSQTQRISKNELTIFGVASSLTDPNERSAFLDRACGDDLELRVRIEERLAVRIPQRPEPKVVDIPMPAPAATATLQPMPDGGDRPDAVALVPMSAMQLAASQQPPRHSPVPWFIATMMAMGVGALSVLLYMEKQAHETAPASNRPVSRLEPDKSRQTSDSKPVAVENTNAGKLLEAAIKERDDAKFEAADAKAEAAKHRTEREDALVREKTANDRTQAALAEVTQLKTAVAKTLQDNSLTLADSLARLGSMQMESKLYAEAEGNLRQALQLREAARADAWLLIENQTLLGSAMVQTNHDADALQLFQTSAAAFDTLGMPANEPARARAISASKRIEQFYKITGRRKEMTDWRKHMDTLSATGASAAPSAAPAPASATPRATPVAPRPAVQ